MTKTLKTFEQTNYEPRYQFNFDDDEIIDTTQNRSIKPKCRRGEQPYFRLVTMEGEAHYVAVSDVFGQEFSDLVTPDYELNLFDFSNKYTFDTKLGKCYERKEDDKLGERGREITLRSSLGWEHYLLRDNTGAKRQVTPKEIIQANQDIWVPPFTLPHVVVPAFPHHAFTETGDVWLVRSEDECLLRPSKLAQYLDKEARLVVKIVSSSGKTHTMVVSDIARTVANHLK